MNAFGANSMRAICVSLRGVEMEVSMNGLGGSNLLANVLNEPRNILIWRGRWLSFTG